MQLLPIIMTTIAGFSTLLGMLCTYIKSKNVNKIISISLAFSAGVILCLSFIDLLPSSIRGIYENNHSLIMTFIYFDLFFIIGYYIIKIINKFDKSPTEGLYRVGVVSFIILFVHNALEGIATYSTSTFDISMGSSLTIAIIMHNIPEGILIAMPIYHSTKNRFKAFKLVLASAIAEPLGAIISYLLFKNIYTETFISYILIIVGGLMISLIINEIIPQIKKYNKYFILNIISFIIGVVFILINLYMF